MIQLDFRDGRPIYEQVKEKFRKLIMQGVLEVDEKMPSVRSMATELTINPNTIQRAYRELEQEGYIYSVPGKGSFVAGVPELDEKRKSELFENFDKLVEELNLAGVSKKELKQRIDKGGEDND